MTRRWTHGHTAATGIAAGLLLDRHTLIVFAIAFTLGILSRELLTLARHALHGSRRIAQAAVDLAEQKVATQQARTTDIRSRTRARRETIRQGKQARQKAEREAYGRGAADVLTEQAARQGAHRA